MDDPNEPLVSIPLTVDEWAVAYSVIHTMVSMASQGPSRASETTKWLGSRSRARGCCGRSTKP